MFDENTRGSLGKAQVRENEFVLGKSEEEDDIPIPTDENAPTLPQHEPSSTEEDTKV